jgi:hypothetical protein
VPLRKREEVQEVLRCPRVGMSGQVRPARFAGPPLNTPQPLLIAGRGVSWFGLWLTTPGTVPEAGEAALDPLS